MLATLQPAGSRGVEQPAVAQLPPLWPTLKVPLSAPNCTNASGIPPERITPLKIKPGGRLRGDCFCKGAKGSTRPDETEAITWLELGRGVSPARGAAGARISTEAGAGAPGAGWLLACGGFSPAQETSSRTAPRKGPRNLRVTGFNKIAESVKVGLKFLGNDSTQDAGIHQRCQDPR